MNIDATNDSTSLKTGEDYNWLITDPTLADPGHITLGGSGGGGSIFIGSSPYTIIPATKYYTFASPPEWELRIEEPETEEDILNRIIAILELEVSGIIMPDEIINYPDFVKPFSTDPGYIYSPYIPITTPGGPLSPTWITPDPIGDPTIWNPSSTTITFGTSVINPDYYSTLKL